MNIEKLFNEIETRSEEEPVWILSDEDFLTNQLPDKDFKNINKSPGSQEVEVSSRSSDEDDKIHQHLCMQAKFETKSNVDTEKLAKYWEDKKIKFLQHSSEDPADMFDTLSIPELKVLFMTINSRDLDILQSEVDVVSKDTAGNYNGTEAEIEEKQEFQDVPKKTEQENVEASKTKLQELSAASSISPQTILSTTKEEIYNVETFLTPLEGLRAIFNEHEMEVAKKPLIKLEVSERSKNIVENIDDNSLAVPASSGLMKIQENHISISKLLDIQENGQFSEERLSKITKRIIPISDRDLEMFMASLAEDEDDANQSSNQMFNSCSNVEKAANFSRKELKEEDISKILKVIPPKPPQITVKATESTEAIPNKGKENPSELRMPRIRSHLERVFPLRSNRELVENYTEVRKRLQIDQPGPSRLNQTTASILTPTKRLQLKTFLASNNVQKDDRSLKKFKANNENFDISLFEFYKSNFGD